MKKLHKDYLLVLACALGTPIAVFMLSQTPAFFHSLRFWIMLITSAAITIITLIVQLFFTTRRVGIK